MKPLNPTVSRTNNRAKSHFRHLELPSHEGLPYPDKTCRSRNSRTKKDIERAARQASNSSARRRVRMELSTALEPEL